MDHELTNRTLRTRRIALAAVLVMAFSQFVLASHQIAHDPSEPEVACSECLLASQFDYSVASATAAILPDAATDEPPAFTPTPSSCSTRAPFAPRAPPLN